MTAVLDRGRARLTRLTRALGLVLGAGLALPLLQACAHPMLQTPPDQSPGAPRPETATNATTAAQASTSSSADSPLQLSGRLSVLSPHRDNQRLQGSQANFELAGTANQGRLELSTPLGSLIARAQWQPGLVSIQTSQGERSYEHLDAMAADLLGEAVPMAALFEWLQSRPWPGAEHLALSAPLVGFQQLGWHVDLSRAPDGLIVAKRLAPPEVTLRVRLDRRDMATP